LNLPVDVSHIEDLPDAARDLGVGADEFRGDTSLTQISTHGEVGDGGDHGDACGDVMEDAVWPWLGEGEASEGDGGGKHDGADGLPGSQRYNGLWKGEAERTKYQSEPCEVMAISEVTPLTMWLPLTWIAMLPARLRRSAIASGFEL